jgi:hypothetical protein
MSFPESTERRLTQAWWFFPALIAVIYFSVLLATSTHYGYFRDALYYLACSEHLDWGYVDQPPLIALIGWIARHTFGTSLPALMLWPALAGCGRLLLTSAFARELGARRFGTTFAAMLAAIPAVWMVIDHQFAMNAFEALFWTGCAFALLRMINTGNPRFWLLFGAIGGLGLENKYSIGVVAFALVAGLLLTPQRKLLFTPWLLAGGGMALLIFLPNLLWNIHHHWPFLELMANIRASGRDIALPPLAFIKEQILMMSPQAFPFWLAGLLFYFFADKAKPYRAFGWAFAITIGFFMTAHGKDYYSAPVYPLVLAAGGLVTELFLFSPRFQVRPRLRLALGSIAFVWLLALKVALLPLILPVLPIDAYVRFQQHLPFEPSKTENNQIGALLPQYYADEFGWPEMVAAVARVYHSLPDDQQRTTAIFADNYGEAAAIDFFGAQYGLPKAICAHQNYFLWGPRGYTGETMILVGSEKIEDARRFFQSVEPVAVLDNPHAMPFENRTVLLGRGLKANLQQAWPSLKRWN